VIRTVRIAIAGCGNVAEKYVPHLRQSEACELVAVCDPLADRVHSFAQTYGIERIFQDVDQMLDTLDFELLVNLTPIQQHAPINRKALEAGRNVWCEKPIATDLRDAQSLLALAWQRGVGLWAAPDNPIAPAFQ
jgi:predicted dehydrogenase